MTTPQQRYHIKNRDKILEYKRKKYKERKIIECECGVKYNEHIKYKHIKSKNQEESGSIKRMEFPIHSSNVIGLEE